MHVHAFCIELQYQFARHLSVGAPSHDGLDILRHFINTWQDSQPAPWFMGKRNTEAYYCTEAHFLDVLDGIARPVSNLWELHLALFPVHIEGFVFYYTPRQVDTLAHVLLDKVLRIITAPGYVWMYKTAKKKQEEQVAPPPAVAMELVTEVLTIQANLQAEKVTQINPVDYRALIDATRDLADTLDLREQCKPPSFAPTAGAFFRSPEDVMFDHEMETAMARSQGHILSATGQSDRELAKALALSQAMDEEQRFERDMALAMAMSRAENGGTGDQELDSLLDSVMPKW